MKSRNSPPPPPTVVPTHHHSSQDAKCGKQGGGAMALVFMAKAGQRLAVGQFEITLGALQRLDVRLFVHR